MHEGQVSIQLLPAALQASDIGGIIGLHAQAVQELQQAQPIIRSTEKAPHEGCVSFFGNPCKIPA
jgi:hypothetical protein